MIKSNTSKRDLLIMLGSAMALSSCGYPIDGRHTDSDSARGLVIHTVAIDSNGSYCATCFLEDKNSGMYPKKITIIDLNMLREKPDVPFVASNIDGEPGFDDSMPIFSEDNSYIYYRSISSYERMRNRSKASTKIVKYRLSDGQKSVIRELSSEAFVFAEFIVSDETFLITTQTMEFHTRGSLRGYGKNSVLKVMRFGKDGESFKSEVVHSGAKYRGPAIVIPGLGYIFRCHGDESINDERMKLAALTHDDMLNNSIRYFNNYDEAFRYIIGENWTYNDLSLPLQRVYDVFRVQLSESSDMVNYLIGSSIEFPKWLENAVYDVNANFAVAIERRSLLDSEDSLHRTNIVLFQGSVVPMEVDVIGNVDFSQFVSAAFT
ncbi:MAG: hypothetical protein IM651_04680 [Phenylobacterium sp.]|nr:hypothetical protein [Phenylobacterium sp.]